MTLNADPHVSSPATSSVLQNLLHSEAVSSHVNPLSKNGRFLQSKPEFIRNEWLLYLSNLSQRAGVPNESIRKLVLKELVDNALDEMDRIGDLERLRSSETKSIFIQLRTKERASVIRPNSSRVASL
jgi:hypothetical protein